MIRDWSSQTTLVSFTIVFSTLFDTVKMSIENAFKGLGTMSLESILQRLEDGRFTSEQLVKVRVLRENC